MKILNSVTVIEDHFVNKMTGSESKAKLSFMQSQGIDENILLEQGIKYLCYQHYFPDQDSYLRFLVTPQEYCVGTTAETFGIPAGTQRSVLIKIDSD